MKRFIRRFIGALALDIVTYEEIEADRSCAWQAGLTIALTCVAGGIVLMSWTRLGVAAIVVGTAVMLGAWAVWLTMITTIGTRLAPESRTRSDQGELFRTLGFASAPGVVMALAALKPAAPFVLVPDLSVDDRGGDDRGASGARLPKYRAGGRGLHHRLLAVFRSRGCGGPGAFTNRAISDRWKYAAPEALAGSDNRHLARGLVVNIFDMASVLVAAAAMFGYLNHRILRLPATTGTLVVALLSSLAIVLLEMVVPGINLRSVVQIFLGEIDFDQTLMHGMLCFLLFAGALHVDIEGLIEQRWLIGTLATIGVLLSVSVVGVLVWAAFTLLGVNVSLLACFTFGALISPTDPIAVMGLLKELRAPRRLESQIAGESLFNDGVGVVVFMGLASLAHLGTVGEATSPGVSALAVFAIREVAGGLGLGLALGYAGYRALKSIDDHSLELLITLALVMFVYTLSFWVHVSGPIAVVVAGLFIGNPGRRLAMSDRTREHIDAFWRMIDGVLNAVLFLLLGLSVFAVSHWSDVVLPALAVVPICLLGRFISVAVPVAAMRVRGPLRRGLIPILTWSGLRGGISVALVLSLPRFPGKEVLLASTYAVVVFSVVVQGLTVRHLLAYYGVGEDRDAA